MKTNTDNLSLANTERRVSFREEWSPGRIAVELEVREVIVWDGDRFQNQNIKRVELAA